MRRFVRLFAFLVLFSPIAAFSQGDTLEGIVRQLDSQQKAVAIVSPDAGISNLLKKAFDLHGAYRITGEAQASFVFRIEPLSENSVRLSILSGRPAQSLFTQDVNGSNRSDAALRAADLAVTKTSGLPGIFAGRLAFISERTGKSELYTGNLFFTEARKLTDDKANCVQPDMSPDGRSIVYTSYYRNGFPDIYKVDLVSGRREPFLSFQGVNTGAVYSPDGSRLAVILSGTGNAELYTINAQARDIKRLTRNKSIESDPSWSPDGQRIVFTSDSLGKPQIFQMQASGGSMQRVPTNISGYCAEPTWNPRNANQIAFTIAQGGEFEIALFDFSTGKSVTLTRGAGDAVDPIWTRDGRHLIYTERTPNYRRLVLMDTVTGTKGYLHDRSWGDSAMADYEYPNR